MHQRLEHSRDTMMRLKRRSDSCSVAIVAAFALSILPSCASQSAPAASASTESSSGAAPGKARPEGSSRAVNVGCGFVLSETHDKVHFHLNLFGKDVRQVPKEGHFWWLVDGYLVESTIAVSDQVGDPGARGPTLLQKYMKWETDYTVKQNGWPPVDPRVEPPFKINGFDALSWTYRFPRPVPALGVELAGIIYLAVAIEDVVFVMAALLRGPTDARPGATVIFDALETIQRTPKPLDVEALSQWLKANPNKPWEGCAPDLEQIRSECRKLSETCVQKATKVVKTHPDFAVKIFRDACDANVAHGCAELGHAYSEGGVLPQDGKRADDAYAKACRLDPSWCD
jgi:hypothetical protein